MRCRTMRFLCLAPVLSLLLSVFVTYSCSATTLIDVYDTYDITSVKLSREYTNEPTTSFATDYGRIVISDTWSTRGSLYNPEFRISSGFKPNPGMQFKLQYVVTTPFVTGTTCPATSADGLWVVDDCQISHSASVTEPATGTTHNYSSDSVTVYGHFAGTTVVTATSIYLRGPFVQWPNVSSGISGLAIYVTFSRMTLYRDIYDDSVQGSLQQNLDAINSQTQQQHQDAQAALEEQKKQTEALEQTKDFVTDTETPSASDIASDETIPNAGLLPAGALDSILNLPLTAVTKLLRIAQVLDSGVCRPIYVPIPFSDGYRLSLPCLGDYIYKGDFASIGNLVGFAAASFLTFNYLKHLYKKVERATSLNATEDDEWGIL